MTKTTEQKFQLHANFWFEISIQDVRDLFCTMGQGSSYWCHDMVVGDIKRDSDGYYLLEDNNTLVMINTKKKNKKNFEFNISKKELSIHKNSGKIDFIISTLAKSCGFKNLSDNYECNFYKPLVLTYIFN